MFTFKKVLREGKWGHFELRQTEIKLNKKKVGSIHEIRNAPFDKKYSIAFIIKKEATEKNPANFKWVFFKNKFPTEEDARLFINKKHEQIISRFDLYQMEEDY